MDWTLIPKQVDGIEINPVADGYIVYQTARDRVHYLNHTAVVVLELCNGSVSAAEMLDLVKAAYALSEAPRDEVAACLTTLLDEGLIQ